MNILVVDNNRTFRTFLTSLLRKEGHTVAEAGDGVEALDVLRDFLPDVAFVDLIMPGIGGDRLCRIIRRLPQLNACRIIVVSAAAAEFDFDYREVGADACIAKGPFHNTAFHVREVLRELGEGGKGRPLQKVYGRQGLHSRGITRELLAKTEQLEGILDGVSEGILEIANGRVLYANRTAIEWLGIPVESLLGRTVPHVLDRPLQRLSLTGSGPEVQIQVNERWLAIRRHTAQAPGVEVLLMADVTHRRRRESIARERLEDRLRERAAALADANDRLRSEIERRRLAEESLRDSEKRYRQLFENAPVGIGIVDSRGRLVSFNDAFSRPGGWTRPELERMDGVAELFVDPLRWEAAARRFDAHGRVDEADLQFRRKDGTFFDALVSLRPVDLRGESAIQMVVQDITDRKQLERQLFQSQKLEAIGTLAGGIAHDFNNLLSGMIGFTELALLDAGRGSVQQANLREVLNAGQRAADLVKQILTFSRRHLQDPKPVDPVPVIKEAVKFLRSSLPATVEIRQDIQPVRDCVKADPTQIHQILMNLCTNAAHAMAHAGGILTVRVRREMPDADFLRRHPQMTAEPHLLLLVSDTGHGIAPDVLPSIFDPYFTTKKKEEGTGLGLSVVHGIVKSAGGEIAVHSVEGEGTLFRIYFPIVSAGTSGAETEAASPATGNERILLVDDEPFQVRLGAQILESLGYTVEAFTRSQDALQRFRESPGSFDLVISDTTMPKMAGDVLAEHILRIRPETPILLTTGYSERISDEKARRMGLAGLLQKPLTTRELSNAVRSALDRRSADGV